MWSIVFISATYRKKASWRWRTRDHLPDHYAGHRGAVPDKRRAGSTQAAVAMGAGDQERAQKTFGGSAVLLTAAAALLTVLFQVFRDPILLLFGARERQLGYASD